MCEVTGKFCFVVTDTIYFVVIDIFLIKKLVH